MMNDDCTHRLICEYCLKPIAHYSFTHTEHKFLDELKTIRCPECDEKYTEFKSQKLVNRLKNKSIERLKKIIESSNRNTDDEIAELKRRGKKWHWEGKIMVIEN